MKNTTIDINCDVGEGIGNEAELLPLISSCNIACGGHAGDFSTMSAVAVMANKNGVRVGAHPSYPDKDNFGRVSMSLSSDDLIESVQYQLRNFVSVLEKENIVLHHIKPHGALYNDIAKNEIKANAFLKGIAAYKNEAFLYVPYASVVADVAKKNGFKIKYEAFADRNYNNDLTLVARSLPNAVIEAPEKVLSHLMLMVRKNQVVTADEHIIKIIADTFCIHGDTASALQILTYLSQELPTHKINVKRE